MYMDSTALLDDCNNPVYVPPTSNAGGGLPLAVVVTLGESTSSLQQAMSSLRGILPEDAFGGRGKDDGPLWSAVCSKNIIALPIKLEVSSRDIPRALGPCRL